MSEFAHPEQLEIRKGWFENTFAVAANEIDQIAVLHCDGDWYDSILLTLETFYPKIAPGGFVVIDDYGCWEGGRRATDEFRRRYPNAMTLVKVDYTGVYWRKARHD